MAALDQFFDVTTPKPTKFSVFNDLRSLHEAMGQPNAPDWVVGTAVSLEKGIYLVDPRKVTTLSAEDYKKVVAHEYVHILQMEKFGTNVMFGRFGYTRLWLNEGLAVYLTKQIDFATSAAAVVAVLRGIKGTVFEYLNTDPTSFGNENGYLISAFLVKYLLESYGKAKLLDCYTSEGLASVFGVSERELDREFRKSLE